MTEKERSAGRFQRTLDLDSGCVFPHQFLYPGMAYDLDYLPDRSGGRAAFESLL